MSKNPKFFGSKRALDAHKSLHQDTINSDLKQNCSSAHVSHTILTNISWVRVHDDDVMYIPIKLENMQLCGLFSLVSIKKKLSQHLFYFFS